MKILVLNCGSSSLKYQLINMEDESVIAKGLCERIGIEGTKLKHEPTGKDDVVIEKNLKDHNDAVKLVMDCLMDAKIGVIKSTSEIAAVGHRVVHGGEFFAKSVLIDKDVVKAIEACCELAPLHNPANLIGIRACEAILPGTNQVAVFDTAFHQTMPEKAYLYAIPYELYEKYKIRRYGFHGTSHKYVSERAADILGKKALKVITCHLGNGASVAAINNGLVQDTSMGFTPLEGLIMGTRCGDIDPAAVTFIMEKEKMTAKDVDNLLNKKSGVLGISGVSSDFRDIEAEAEKGNKRATIALEMFYYRVAKYIGEYSAAMNGVDAVVFTAGLGENSYVAREKISEYIAYLGAEVDKEKNKCRGKEVVFSTANSKVKLLCVPTNEELVIARDTRALV